MDFIWQTPVPIMTAIGSVPFLWLLAKSISSRLQRLLFLFYGLDIIDKAYAKARGKSFKVCTPDNDILMVTSDALLREVKLSTHRNLSINAAATELLQPRYTMSLFQWTDHRKTSDGGAFPRALRLSLTSQLTHFQPRLESIIDGEFQAVLGQQRHNEAWARIRIFPMVKHLVSKLNCFVFFGPDLWENEEFVVAALAYPQTTVVAAELLRTLKLPGFLCPLVAGLATNWNSAERTMVRLLSPIIQHRMETRAMPGEDASTERNIDVMQFMVDASPRSNWTVRQMLGQILAVWVPSVHQISMVTTFAIEDLCVHSEYVEPLRQEIRDVLGSSDTSPRSARELDRLPLLDSFLRESIRMTNTDPIIMRRKALEPQRFSDGSWVAKGDWVCVPQQAIMKDTMLYKDPDTFNGFRFAQANELLRCGKRSPHTPDKVETKLSDATYEWSPWGMDPVVCPGRWYAALVIKLIVVHVLENWDCELASKQASRSMTWRSNCFPRSDTEMLFRKLH